MRFLIYLHDIEARSVIPENEFSGFILAFIDCYYEKLLRIEKRLV